MKFLNKILFLVINLTFIFSLNLDPVYNKKSVKMKFLPLNDSSIFSKNNYEMASDYGIRYVNSGSVIHRGIDFRSQLN